jgi:hypothetical protein
MLHVSRIRVKMASILFKLSVMCCDVETEIGPNIH